MFSEDGSCSPAKKPLTPSKKRAAFNDVGNSPTVSPSTTKETLPLKRKYDQMECEEPSERKKQPASTVDETDHREKINFNKNTTQGEEDMKVESEPPAAVQDEKIGDGSGVEMEVEGKTIEEFEAEVSKNCYVPRLGCCFGANHVQKPNKIVFDLMINKFGENGMLPVKDAYDFLRENISTFSEIDNIKEDEWMDFEQFQNMFVGEWGVDPVEVGEFIHKAIVARIPMVHFGVIRSNPEKGTLQCNGKGFTLTNARIAHEQLEYKYGIKGAFEGKGFIEMDNTKHIKAIYLFKDEHARRAPAVIFKNLNL
jgi:hypothetical protein